MARHNMSSLQEGVGPVDYPSLAIVIAQIRRELTEALEEGQGELVQFVVGEIELEFAVEVEKRGGGEGGVRLGVVTLAAKGEAVRSDTNRIRVVLKPALATGNELQVASPGERRPDAT